jgi:hypothetical protein
MPSVWSTALRRRSRVVNELPTATSRMTLGFEPLSQTIMLVSPIFLGTTCISRELRTTTSTISGSPTETRLMLNPLRMNSDLPSSRSRVCWATSPALGSASSKTDCFRSGSSTARASNASTSASATTSWRRSAFRLHPHVAQSTFPAEICARIPPIVYMPSGFASPAYSLQVLFGRGCDGLRPLAALDLRREEAWRSWDGGFDRRVAHDQHIDEFAVRTSRLGGVPPEGGRRGPRVVGPGCGPHRTGEKVQAGTSAVFFGEPSSQYP